MGKSEDETFMDMALELARLGMGTTSPNPMVGAVVVKDGRVVGKGYHEKAGGPHAEAAALDAAGPHARGATLYVTLEPCNHFGRTPPCTHRILESCVGRVVMAMEDPNPRVTGGGRRYLEQRAVAVTCGVREADARELNAFFVKHVTTGRPFVILKCATTLDGRIATSTGDSKWITNELSRGYVHELRHAVDAVMVGVGTVHRDDPRLTTRLGNRRGRDPLRVVLDSHLSISEAARLLHLDSESDCGTVIAAVGPAPAQRRTCLERLGATVWELPAREGRVDVEAVVTRLGQMGILSLLIEGGSRVHASALKAGIVDKVSLFFAPKILGGDDGVPVFRGPGCTAMDACWGLTEVRVQRFGDDVLIEGRLTH